MIKNYYKTIYTPFYFGYTKFLLKQLKNILRDHLKARRHDSINHKIVLHFFLLTSNECNECIE